jgi:hypothetical protein
LDRNLPWSYFDSIARDQYRNFVSRGNSDRGNRSTEDFGSPDVLADWVNQVPLPWTLDLGEVHGLLEKVNAKAKL